MSTFGNEDVRRLDIPMNDTRRVRRIQRVCDLNRKRQEQICLQRTPGDAMLQHDAIQKLHGDERLLATFADLVNCADVGMVEGGGCASFTPETFQSLRITGNVVGQELQGDEAAKLSVLGLVDHTHPAAAELLDNAVVRNGLAVHNFHLFCLFLSLLLSVSYTGFTQVCVP